MNHVTHVLSTSSCSLVHFKILASVISGHNIARVYGNQDIPQPLRTGIALGSASNKELTTLHLPGHLTQEIYKVLDEVGHGKLDMGPSVGLIAGVQCHLFKHG